jgi:recombination protein RecA
MASKKEEKQENLKETLASLEKAYGKGTVLTLNAKSDTDLEVYSTGSIGFDYEVLGIGGFARGKLYEIMGWEGSGKSTICGHAVAECQKAGGTALYIDGEHAVDKTYFESLGVDTSKMLFSQPSSGEEGFNVALELINTGEIHMVIIDSDSALLPKKQVDGDIGDSAMGSKAKLNSSAYPKLKPALSKHNVCVIVISQYREKIGVMFGDPRTTQGGHALKFYADVRIEMSKSLAKDGDIVFGNTTKVKTIKNKMCPPYRKAEFDIIYGEGIDRIGEIMELAKQHKLGKRYKETYTFDGVKYLEEEFREKCVNDSEFYSMIVTRILNAIKGIESPKDDSIEEISDEV